MPMAACMQVAVIDGMMKIPLLGEGTEARLAWPNVQLAAARAPAAHSSAACPTPDAPG